MERGLTFYSKFKQPVCPSQPFIPLSGEIFRLDLLAIPPLHVKIP
jgi:hypothetical protein